MSGSTEDEIYQRLIDQAADDPDWDDNKVKKLAAFIRVWKDTQLLHSPSTSPLDIAQALEIVAAEIRAEFGHGTP